MTVLAVPTDLTSALAEEIVAAAVAKAEDINTRMNIAVVDSGANLKAFVRMDRAWLGSIDIACKKAKTARYFDMPTGAIGELSQPGGPLFNIEVSNDGNLAPGQFVDITMRAAPRAPVLAVPHDAVVLILGNPMVFALEDEEFEPRPVEVGRTTAEWRVVTAGLEPGEEIAVAGVFQLKSLLLKSQIGDSD